MTRAAVRFDRVLLIGGAPGAGKSTLASALARRCNIMNITADDLLQAAQAITTPETHPGLHVMRRLPSQRYFTETAPEQLIADAAVQHEAVWPLVVAVVRKYVAAGQGLVLDGWFLWPRRVIELKLDGVLGLWLVTAPEVLRQREAANRTWLRGSSDPQRMLENFLARSLDHNARVRQRVMQYEMPFLEQDGTRSVEQLCDEALHLVTAIGET